uniref:NADH-ubiquinone oxidoreductase chain 4L n=1 Tax=Chelonarium sp. BMNH 840450 TaxID=1903803 RepID=A0A343A3I0_9COLE|nr:NADH dehydrogenase subunit 4L [Chelonarium sp. BMNH 840450]
MYFSGLLCFCSNRKHLLLVLLSLEFVILSLYFGLFLYFSFLMVDLYFVMIFLTMSVCEGALGLSVLVSVIRTHGNDYLGSINFLW